MSKDPQSPREKEVEAPPKPAETGPLARNRTLLLILGGGLFVVAAVVVAFLVGRGGRGVSDEETGIEPDGALEHTIYGTFTLSDFGGSGVLDLDSGCTGSGGYDDIGEGTQVVVKDGSGEVLSTGSLGTGEGGQGFCVFAFDVGGVPDSDFYSIEVSHRGDITYSRQELESSDWTVDLSLG